MVNTSEGSDPKDTVAAVWRIESPKVVARVARMVGDVGLAEDFAQDAFVAALEHWPESGIPDNPGAWLTTTAKRRALDHLRRSKRLDRKHEELGRELEVQRELTRSDAGGALDPVGDDLLRLMFVCCHPVLPTEARVALTLRLLGGLSSKELARAFLVPVPTLQQRIVRAKRTLREEGVPFELPPAAELGERLGSVLAVLYLVFNEGYAATAGQQWIRPRLCGEALRLGRILVRLAPEEPEVHGLLALMELQASRLDARVGPSGEPVRLDDQDRSRWDRLLISRGLAALERAEALGEGARGPYTLQAAIAACHARATTPDETDWPRIAALYEVLAEVAPSPVVELNRAVAVGRAHGPEPAMAIVEDLASDPTLEGYHLLPAVRGHLLAELDRRREAREAFERAASLTRNEPERELLLRRAEACGP